MPSRLIGRTPDFGSENWGSNPWGATYMREIKVISWTQVWPQLSGYRRIILDKRVALQNMVR